MTDKFLARHHDPRYRSLPPHPFTALSKFQPSHISRSTEFTSTYPSSERATTPVASQEILSCIRPAQNSILQHPFSFKSFGTTGTISPNGIRFASHEAVPARNDLEVSSSRPAEGLRVGAAPIVQIADAESVKMLDRFGSLTDNGMTPAMIQARNQELIDLERHNGMVHYMTLRSIYCNIWRTSTAMSSNIALVLLRFFLLLFC